MIIKMLENRRLRRLTEAINHRGGILRNACFCVFALSFFLTAFQKADAQTIPWPDDYRIYFVADSARCGDDGKIRYGILHKGEDPMRPDEYDTIRTPERLAELGLSSIRIFKKTNPGDSAQYSHNYYTGGEDTFQIAVAGTYYVGVEALHGVHQLYQTIQHITIGTDYIAPQTPALMHESVKEFEFGNRPSLSCANTGRIQLEVVSGRYPFVETIVRLNDDNSETFFRRDTIWGPQEGNDPERYDYRNYYSVESLPPGTWKITPVDGCRKQGQYTIQEVESVEPPHLDHIEVLAAAPHENDSNIVQIYAVLSSDNEYYLHQATQKMKYRFFVENSDLQDCDTNHALHPGYAAHFNDFPESNKNRVLISDTIEGAHAYCDIWGSVYHTFHFGIIYDECGDTMRQVIHFDLEKPNEKFFITDSTEVVDSIVAIDECRNRRYAHLDSYTIRYHSYQPKETTNNREDVEFRYHYSHPLVWLSLIQKKEGDVYIDDYDTLKIDTIAHINDPSSLTALELGQYMNSYTLPITGNIKRQLIDAHGCILYDAHNAVKLNYVEEVTSPSHVWRITTKDGDHCCETPRSITLTENGTPLYESIGITTVELINSPYHGRYNFSITYDPVTQTWSEPIRHNLANSASIGGDASGRTLTLSQECLPSGKYEFLVTTANCGGGAPIVIVKQFGDVYSTEIVDYPARVEEQDCSNLKVRYTAGRANLVRRHTDIYNDTDPDPNIDSCVTKIQIIQGPHGGFNNRRYNLNEDIHLSIPGTYVAQITPVPPGGRSLCEDQVFDYDTIHYESAALEFDYAEALLCRKNDHTGQVYIRGINGAMPITYTIIVGRDTVASNTTGIFHDIPFFRTDTVYGIIEDNCHAINQAVMHPTVLETLQKVWFDDGETSTSICEGQSLHLNALQVGDIFKFHWWYVDTLEDGINTRIVELDTSSNPNLFIEHGAQTGWYHVNIVNTGCIDFVEDSVYVEIKPAPKIRILRDTTVCPNQPATLSFIPLPSDMNRHQEDITDADTIFFTIAYSNEDGVELRDYFGRPYDVISDEFTSASLTKVYPVHILENISDNCPYDAADPEDTVYVSMDIANMVDLCAVTTHDTTVCYKGTAHLRARSTAGEYPYTLNWFEDYAQTNLLHSEVINDGRYSYHDTSNLTSRAILFVNVDLPNRCPAINGVTNKNVVLQDNGKTELDCIDVYQLSDPGGEDGDYTPNEVITHKFYTTDRSPVMLHFNSLELSHTSDLFILSGGGLWADSVIYHLKSTSPLPEYIISNSDTMTFYFVAGKMAAPGWDAVIQHTPGIVMANVHPLTLTTLSASVCQKADASKCGAYPYKKDVNSIGVNDKQVWKDMAKSGTYTYEGKVNGKTDIHGCDTNVRVILNVLPPPSHDTTVVITSMDLPYIWDMDPENPKTESRIYSKIVTSNSCNCDTLEILNLIVLKVTMTDNQEICDDDADCVKLGISDVEVPEDLLSNSDMSICAIGDVLCTNGQIMHPDTFIAKSALDPTLHAKGVVFDVDENCHGRAIALKDATDSISQWAFYSTTSHGQEIYSLHTYSNQKDAVTDMFGLENTSFIRKKCLELFPGEDPYICFKTHAPAAFACFYYDHESCYTGGSTTGMDTLGWYLPGAGELYLYFVRRDIVNSTLYKLKENGHGAKLPYEGVPHGDKFQPKQCTPKPIDNQAVELDCKYHTSTDSWQNSQKSIVFRIDYKGMINKNDQHWKYIPNRLYIEGVGDVHQVKKGYVYKHFARAVIRF